MGVYIRVWRSSHTACTAPTAITQLFIPSHLAAVITEVVWEFLPALRYRAANSANPSTLETNVRPCSVLVTLGVHRTPSYNRRHGALELPTSHADLASRKTASSLCAAVPPLFWVLQRIAVRVRPIWFNTQVHRVNVTLLAHLLQAMNRFGPALNEMSGSRLANSDVLSNP